MASPIAITIGGTAVTPVEESSINIDSILGQTVDTARLSVYDKNANLAIPEQVDIIITRTDTGERIFGGLTSIVDGRTDGLARWWDLQCQDYTILLDAGLVYASYPSGWTYDGLSGDQAIIAHLFEMAGVGLGTSVASEIEARTYVETALSSMAAMYFNYVTYREALQTITGYTGWNYHVDYNKHLHYYYRETHPAPYGLSSSPDGVTTIGYRNLKWHRDGTAVRNFYVMFGANLFSSTQTYYLAGNSVKLTFTLGLADIGRNVILVAPPGNNQILVDVNTGTELSPVWTAQVVGLEGFDLAASVDCLHNPTQQILVFNNAPPTLSNAVRIRAVYQLNAGQADADGDSIVKYGRTFARRLTAADANSATALAKKLENYKSQFAFALEKCTLLVDSAEFPGSDRFEVGQWVSLYNAVLGINRSFLIHRVTTKIIGGQLLEYELELRNYFSDIAA